MVTNGEAPLMGTSGADTYEHRWLQDPEAITAVEINGDWISIDCKGSGFGIPAKRGVTTAPQVGQMCAVEVVNGSRVAGVQIDGEWLFRLTDAELQREHEEMMAGFARKREERLEADRADLLVREAKLPDWARYRLARFRANGGHDFELNGWSYELHIVEYAAAMVAGDQSAIKEHEAQASGNTHECATFLARLVREGRKDDAAGRVPAGISPLTGSADFS